MTTMPMRLKRNIIIIKGPQATTFRVTASSGQVLSLHARSVEATEIDYFMVTKQTREHMSVIKWPPTLCVFRSI